MLCTLQASADIMRLLAVLCPGCLLEKASIDEAYLDITSMAVRTHSSTQHSTGWPRCRHRRNWRRGVPQWNCCDDCPTSSLILDALMLSRVVSRANPLLPSPPAAQLCELGRAEGAADEPQADGGDGVALLLARASGSSVVLGQGGLQQDIDYDRLAAAGRTMHGDRTSCLAFWGAVQRWQSASTRSTSALCSMRLACVPLDASPPVDVCSHFAEHQLFADCHEPVSHGTMPTVCAVPLSYCRCCGCAAHARCGAVSA